MGWQKNRQTTLNVTAPPPPPPPVKLLFIHHSVGGLWLAHDNGGLVNSLNGNNYYVNDITYGWEPSELTNTNPKKIKRFFQKAKRKVLRKITGERHDESGAYGIGNRTDIGHMPEWFLGSYSKQILDSVYTENLETASFGDRSNATSENPLANPDLAGENQVIMFKSCYPNALLKGNPADPPVAQNLSLHFSAGSEQHTISNAKMVFNGLLMYFSQHQDKFFVIVTPPPMINLPENGNIARGFSNWLVHSWLQENNYEGKNVMVFDLFNVLTSRKDGENSDAGDEQGNHHRIWQGKVQHVVQEKNNLLVYARSQGDNHPNSLGLQKATEEFVPLLNYYYNHWALNNE